MAQNPELWIYQVTKSDVDDIDKCLGVLRDRQRTFEELEIRTITRKQIDLGNFGQTLLLIRKDVLDGIGFRLIRRIPIEKYSRFEICVIYWCIGLYLGLAISQNAKVRLYGLFVVCLPSNRVGSGP